MTRDSRYDILFEPVKIGPVTTKNRFYQVPHCNGMGHTYPASIAASRGVKAAGGWSVISTEECEIHPTSDVSPYIEARLWDDEDMKRLQLSTDAIHEHGALAAIELVHQGHDGGNRYSRLPVMGVSDLVVHSNDPNQAYAMSKKDIANVRKMHINAARRAKKCGFDIVYVYAGHDLSLPFHFLNPRHNQRTDEYGGSLENRVRFLKELLIDTKEAIGDQCGIAIRLAVDELLDEDGIVSQTEGREIVEMLAELPDLWDVNISDWSNDSQTSRFSPEAYQEPYVSFVKKMTTKPVVGVGRFTSPDTMVSQIKRGVLDLIGAARPSIADPFLPKKIEQGQLEDIRECIGCNICVSGDATITPIRCTQNPTMGEEYRKGWHPEKMNPATSKDRILVVGAGPAGLEAALSLGRRGHHVVLAEALDQPGGRVINESALPGLSAWKRVVDYRLGQIEKHDHIELHRQSELTMDEILELSDEMTISHIALATGSTWRSDGIGRNHHRPIPHDDSLLMLSPEAIFNDAIPDHVKRAVVYDDDHFYMGSVIAESLVQKGIKVTFVTPAHMVAHWTQNTLEQEKIERRLYQLGVTILPHQKIANIADAALTLDHINANQQSQIESDAVILVTSRIAKNALYFELSQHRDHSHDSQSHAGSRIKTITRVGDCLAPSTIAAAVYHGHRFAREFDLEIGIDTVPFKREYVQIA